MLAHVFRELEAALPGRPSYVSLGPAFPTPTKPDIEIAGADYIKQGLATLAETGISHVAKHQNTTDAPATRPRTASAIGAVSISTIRAPATTVIATAPIATQ